MSKKINIKFFIKILSVLVICVALFTVAVKLIQNWDDDPERGAVILSESKFGDHYDTVFPSKKSEDYLAWQGWEPEDSMWFYTTTQGSNLLPYDFYIVLEQIDSEKLFRADENIDAYRYIPLKPTFSNPDGLALGFVKDTYKGKEYMGLTCAACHTSQINYDGVAMRIDGGAAMADMQTFINGLSESLQATYKDPEKKKRFIAAVMERNGLGKWLSGGRNFSSDEEVEEAMETYFSRIKGYAYINHSDLEYGYGRLDAFGRIFNRTAQHVLNKKQMKKALLKVITAEQTETVLKGVDESVITDHTFDNIVKLLTPILTEDQFAALRADLFNPPDAPVSYPFLWDIPQHDYVQWNGIAANADLGPIGRNSGEAIGVFGTLDWHEEEGISLDSISAFIGGQEDFRKFIRYDSSINVNNLERMERHLRSLNSPLWPETVLPAIDKVSARRGHKVYQQRCVSCHADINRTDPARKIVANFTRVETVGTDPKMATNALTSTGYSGITEKQYLKLGEGSLVMEERMPVAALLTAATTSVVATPDPDKWFLRRWADWAYTLAASYLDNKIKPSLKRGDYDPDTSVNPFASLNAYKARPLNGIWATAPYLHNGSVPTLYDLLLAKRGKNDPAKGEYRPDSFVTGSREFDPVKVGFKSSGYDGSKYDTSLEGNSNAGHNYSDGMSKQNRMDLLEYLKTL